jgi:uncharacterized LabA/DUF88 family protein
MGQSSAEAVKRGNIAILIDGDNAQPALLGAVLLEAARFGRPSIRRIYGDWTAPNMNSWKKSLHEHAISPVQQFRNTVGKNATDCTMIIDAMDILNSRTVNAFCIISSDSDYTRLAMRIREDGILVIGIGKQSTPQAFIKACDVFVRTELLAEQPVLETPPPQIGTVTVPPKPQPGAKKVTPRAVKATKAAPPPQPTPVKGSPPINLLLKAFEMSVQDDGRASLSSLGAALRQIDPAFDSRSWGYAQLSQMIEAAKTRFGVVRNGNSGAIYVSLKKPK